MELQKILNGQSDPEKEEQNEKHHISSFKTILQSSSHQTSKVFHKKDTQTNGTELGAEK